MMTPEKLSLSDFVSRRLHPVKLAIQLLQNASRGPTDNGSTKVDTPILESTVATLQLFIEDYEKLIEKSAGNPRAPAVERKFVGDEAKKS